jgi:hypothetical protein
MANLSPHPAVISAGANDGGLNGTPANFDAAGGNIWMGQGPGVAPGHGYWRFATGVTDLDGATVSACVFNTRAGDSTNHVHLRIWLVKAAAPAAPTDVDTYNGLALTTAYVDWGPLTTADGERYNSPDLSTLLQEVIDGTSGNLTYIEVVIKDNGSAAGDYTTFTSYDAYALWCATLSVTYTAGGGGTPAEYKSVVMEGMRRGQLRGQLQRLP